MTDQLFPVDEDNQTPPTEKAGSARVYPQNPQWDALVALFGPARTRTSEKLYGKISGELAEAGYGKADILLAARLYHSSYQGITFTATALLKHIDQLMYESQKDEQRRGRRTAPRLVVLPDLGEAS